MEALNDLPDKPEPQLCRRLLEHGERSLSDRELLALVVGSACGERMAMAQAELLLADMGSLHGLRWKNPKDLQTVLSPRQSCAVLAALELGRRWKEEQPRVRPRVATSHDAFELLREPLGELPHEEFWLLLLDRGGHLLTTKRVSMGGLHGTVADPKVIYKVAIDARASGLVLAHNHPSGQLRPSAEDLSLTKKLVEAGRVLDITVMDHVIVAHTGYYSFADNGLV